MEAVKRLVAARREFARATQAEREAGRVRDQAAEAMSAVEGEAWAALDQEAARLRTTGLVVPVLVEGEVYVARVRDQGVETILVPKVFHSGLQSGQAELRRRAEGEE